MLHLSRFNVSKLTKDGREGICRVCRSEKRKQNGLNAPAKTEKNCSKCKNVLEITFFTKDTSRDDGYSTICKGCKSETYEEYMEDPISKERAKERSAIWKEEHPEKVREQYQKNKKKRNIQITEYHNSPRGRYTTIKAQAKQREIEYELTKDFINQFWDTTCYYCGDPLDMPRFDRLNSDEGYTERNVVPCCWRCNCAKMEMTEQKFLKHSVKIVEYSKDRIIYK